MKALAHRAVWRLAAPLMLGNVCTALFGLADTAVAGRLPAPCFLGAVAVASVVFDAVYWSAGFLRMSATGVVARLHGPPTAMACAPRSRTASPSRSPSPRSCWLCRG